MRWHHRYFDLQADDAKAISRNISRIRREHHSISWLAPEQLGLEFKTPLPGLDKPVGST
jgi:hypothetical protein